VARDQAKSRVLGLAHGTALVKLDDGDVEETKVSRRTLMWCGIGLGAAIFIPVFIYFAPHFL